MQRFEIRGMAQTFVHEHRVTYSECTVGNHVYYSRYLDFLEEARGEFLRQAGVPLSELQQQEIAFPVIEARLRYKAPARYDDTVRIELWLTELGKLRVNFAYRITSASGLLVEAQTWHVCANLQEKPRRIPEQVIEKLQPFLLNPAGDTAQDQ